MAGSTKLFQPIEEIVKMLPWAAEMPAGLVRFIGLLLPSILRIQPKLTVFAAIGLTIVQVLATGFHLSCGETSVIGMNFLLIAMAVFIAWDLVHCISTSPPPPGPRPFPYSSPPTSMLLR
jgi:hypothetical protein